MGVLTPWQKTLTLHNEPAQRRTPHPAPWSVGGADVDPRVLQRHIGDHQVPSAQNLNALNTDGATVCTTQDKRGDG